MGETLNSMVVYALLQPLLFWVGAIIIIWLVIYYKMNKTKKRTQIAMALIEKNSDMDVQQLMEQLTPKLKQKSLKERLLQKLLWGIVCSMLGLGLLIYAGVAAYVGGANPDQIEFFCFWGAGVLVVGIAFLINYVVSKKMLAKEIAVEERELTEKA